MLERGLLYRSSRPRASAVPASLGSRHAPEVRKRFAVGNQARARSPQTSGRAECRHPGREKKRRESPATWGNDHLARPGPQGVTIERMGHLGPTQAKILKALGVKASPPIVAFAPRKRKERRKSKKPNDVPVFLPWFGLCALVVTRWELTTWFPWIVNAGLMATPVKAPDLATASCRVRTHRG